MRQEKKELLGSGMKVEDVNSLLKRFEQMQKMMKQFSGAAGKKRFPKMSLLPGLGNLGKFKF